MANPPRIILCSSSVARQALCLLTRPMITLLSKKYLTYDEEPWDVSSSIIPHPQHIENIDLKWQAVVPSLQMWKRFDTTLWNRFIGVVCDTVVYDHGHARFKPLSLAQTHKWFESYIKTPPLITTCCKGGLYENQTLLHTFMYHHTSRLQFCPNSQSDIIRYLDNHYSTVRHMAGAIHVEVFLANRWVMPPKTHFDLENIIGLPISALIDDLEAKRIL